MDMLRSAVRFGVITAALLLAVPALADRGGNGHGGGHGGHGRGRGGGFASVPEFDPSVAGVIAAAVAGGAVVVARRRKR